MTFSGASFEKIITKIAECGVCSTLEELDLRTSANFSEEKSVKSFADILAIAPFLKMCDIGLQ